MLAKMNMNPSSIMKIMNAKKQFTNNHPKFMAFLKAVLSRPLDEGTIIEITVTRPGEEPITSNLKVQQSDLDLINELNHCPFAARCEYCMQICKEAMPEETLVDGTHKVSCWLQHPNAPKVKSFYEKEV